MAEFQPRHARIVELARSDGAVTVEALAAHFGLAPQTIRRDLNELCAAGSLVRVHGGAVPPEAVEALGNARNLAYDRRRLLAARAKRAIGRAAAALVPERASLFINIGTTTEAVAQALAPRDGLLVVTNNINVANILRLGGGSEVVIAGGMVRPADGGVVGEAAVEFIRQFKVDIAVIGTSAIDADGSLLDYDFREVSVARAIMAGARRVILVADGDKTRRAAPVRIARLTDVDVWVTDASPPAALAELCAEEGVQVVVADPLDPDGENGDDA